MTRSRQHKPPSLRHGITVPRVRGLARRTPRRHQRPEETQVTYRGADSRQDLPLTPISKSKITLIGLPSIASLQIRRRKLHRVIQPPRRSKSARRSRQELFGNAKSLPERETLSSRAKRGDETESRKDSSRDRSSLSSHDPGQGTVLPTSELLTTAEVADFLRVNRSTICRLAARGELPAFRIGSDWRFSRERIEAWLRSRNPAPEED